MNAAAFLESYAAGCDKMLTTAKRSPEMVRTPLRLVADACRNAGGSLDKAREIIRVAKQAAIDARDPVANHIGVQQVALVAAAKRAGVA